MFRVFEECSLQAFLLLWYRLEGHTLTFQILVRLVNVSDGYGDVTKAGVSFAVRYPLDISRFNNLKGFHPVSHTLSEILRVHMES